MASTLFQYSNKNHIRHCNKLTPLANDRIMLSGTFYEKHSSRCTYLILLELDIDKKKCTVIDEHSYGFYVDSFLVDRGDCRSFAILSTGCVRFARIKQGRFLIADESVHIPHDRLKFKKLDGQEIYGFRACTPDENKSAGTHQFVKYTREGERIRIIDDVRFPGARINPVILLLFIFIVFSKLFTLGPTTVCFTFTTFKAADMDG